MNVDIVQEFSMQHVVSSPLIKGQKTSDSPVLLLCLWSPVWSETGGGG